MKAKYAAIFLFALSCDGASCQCTPNPPKGTDSGSHASLTVANDTSSAATVYVTFGSDSVVGPSYWAFCTVSGLTCSFPIAKNATMKLPLSGSYLNATISFNTVAGCGSTKAELNINNPKWYDIADVSLVDGYSNNIAITVGNLDAGGTVLGPPNGKAGNEKVFGLFPYGCDICVARQAPPCGISKGADGCKTGSQYNPDVPCQYQGTVMGGGSSMTVSLVD